jgi:phosphorylated CTD-interacting factor 1
MDSPSNTSPPHQSTYGGAHGSAFLDTDAPFGSVGSFFDMAPRCGSFEVNPPFVVEVMLRMVEHITALLAASQGPLSFVVVVPVWEACPFYTALKTHSSLRRAIFIPREEHGYCDGASHQRQDRYRDSPYDSCVFVLQNAEGAAAWPCTEAVEESIRVGFSSAIPSDVARLRQVVQCPTDPNIPSYCSNISWS